MSTLEPPQQDAVMDEVQHDDPYDWTIEQVVSALCDPESSYLHSKPAAQIPDLESLGRSLRDNDVDGTTLLTGINGQELKDDLGLKKLGQRTTILNAIRTLRARSAKYQENAPAMGLPASPFDQRFTTPFSRHTSVAFGGLRTGFESPTLQALHGRRGSESTSAVTHYTPNGVTNPCSLSETPNAPLRHESVPPSGIDNQKPSAMTPTSLEPSDPTSKSTVDTFNLSKRRLSTGNRSVPDGENLPDADANADNSPVIPSTSTQRHSDAIPTAGGRKRRRVELQTVTDPSSLVQNPLFNAPLANSIPQENFSARNIFFSTDHSSNFEDPEPFFSTGGSHRVAAKLYMNKLIKYRFRQPRVSLGTHDGKECTAIIPYAHRLVRGSQPQYIHVFVADPEGVTLRKDPLSDWPDLEEQVLENHSAVQLNGQESKFKVAIQWDKELVSDPFSLAEKEKAFFANLEKYRDMDKPDDEAEPLPMFGESDSEDCNDSEEERDVEESRTVPTKPKPFSSEEVSTAIDDSIDTIVENWRNRRLPTLEKKTFKVWTKSRRNNNKHSQIGEARQDIAYIERRIKELRSSLQTGHEWTNAKDVQKACGILDGNVEDLEELKWKIGVLELKKCPQKPPPSSKADRAERAPSKPPSLVDGEEILERESIFGSEDDIEEFIDNDEALPEPIIPPPLAGDGDEALDFADVDDNMDVDDDVQLPGPVTSEEDSDDEVISPQSRRLMRQRNAMLAEGGIDNKDYLSLQPLSQPRTNLMPSDSSLPVTPVRQKKFDIVDLTISSQESGRESGRFGVSKGLKVETGKGVTTPTQSRLKFTPQATGFKVPRLGWLVDNETSDSATEAPVDSFSFFDVAKKDWEELELNRDNKRLLIKLCLEMQDELRHDLVELVRQIDQERLEQYVKLALDAFNNNEKIIQGMSHSTSQGSKQVALLWISWVTCDSMHEQTGIPIGYIEAAKTQMDGFSTYASFLRSVLKSYINYKNPVVIPSTPETGSIKKGGSKGSLQGTMFHDFSSTESADENSMPIPAELTPHKKRKRRVHEDKAAKATRMDDQRRVEDSQKAQTLVMKKLIKEGVSNKDPNHQAVSFEEPVIYLHPEIGGLVKAHQLSGLQFMWREIIQDKNRQGCLLAHTMGLGKTMQVISLLVTIAIGLKSTDPAIRKQLPSSWKRTQALILCPPGLIDNWIEEFRIWTPQPFKDYLISLQAVRTTTQDSAKRTNDRLRQISDWYETGGILIISYELFRTLVKNEPTKTRPAPLNLLQKNKLDRELLGGPDIIIADEAHKMKNPTSSISEAASQFRSRSRIALTGSPLANNLEEYFAMIDWVAPKYLGDIVEFRAKYVEPIKDGLYADSSSYEKRRALTKLSILNKNIDPKINRADITTMKNEMPPKTEFLITVALTKVQTDAYNIFTNAHLHGTGDVTQTRLFSWLKLMLLICNHPHCFRQRLLEKPKASKGAAASRRNSTDEMSGMSDSDIEISHPSAPASTGMSQELIQQMLSLLEAEPDLKSPYMSNKAVILTHIVRQSMKAGDKVLVFSQSIPTINYLEWLCETHLDVRTARLTGETVMSTRQGSAKSFNKAGSLKHVYLISTKAGGLGLNLYGANRVVIFDFDFNPTWEEQAVGRAYRFGQKKPVYVYRLKAGGTFEDVIEMKTVFKTQLASRVVDKKNPIRFASKSAKDYLFPPKQLQQKDVDEFRGNDPEVLDKILDLELSLIRALDLTETFHKEDDEKLTEQEEQMVQTELKGELLRRDDPDAYGEWVKARQQEEMSKRLNDLQQPTNLQGSVAAQLGGLGPSMQMASRPSPSLPRPPTNFQAARVPARMQAVSGYTGPYTNPLQPLPRSTSHQQGSTQPNLISATTISGTDPPPSLPTPLTALPLTSDEGKGKASDVPDTGVQRSVATSLTINGPETDETEGIENEDQSPPDDQDAAERTKWQEQRDKLAARTTTPLYIPLSTEQPRLHENALDRAFAANEHVVHPPRDSEEWKAMKKGGFNVWKGPFKKRMESYDKARYGPKEYSAELWRSYGNPLEIHWCAQKGQEEQEMREVEKQQRGVERGPSSSPYFRRSNQEERVEEQGTPAGEERVQPGPEESGESGSGDGVELTGRSVIDGKGM